MRKYIFFLRIYKKCILRFTWQYFHNLFEDESREQSIRFGVPYKAFALSGRQACGHEYPGRCPGLGASALSGREGNGRGVRGSAGMREGKCNSNQAHEDYQAKVQTMLGKWHNLYIRLAALGNLQASFHCALWHNLCNKHIAT